MIVSEQDHVVAPESSDHIVACARRPLEKVVLTRSYHVATIDFDKDLINERAVHFARRVTA